MAKSYEQILKQIETLKSEADKLRRKETGEVVARDIASGLINF